MGFFWALLSVGLVSAAQLLLRSAMVALPPLTDIVAFLQHLLHFQPGTFGLFFGLLGYLLSMVCWYFALHRLPLSKAYALLSLSYILVWAAAIWLPGWHEPFYWQIAAGRGDHRRRRIDHLLAGETPLAGEPAFGTARAEQDRQLAASDGGFHPDFTDAG
ncbi:4-amino-4-deoxy-L-arabinose-phospho-UDP flippase subunit F [Klebsiella pneumoniae]|uniref:Probable 4-amino-4-deoxy-L-arabinose-phosphoundecaprenol flippase subunit ArnF n=3 Tax=Bacteria TaxID=2 RepID=A0A3S4KFZ0_KLEPN|nr:4-amino-4-deoxy-L-arabinose-phospho-UDP flippase subunit F [Klebsiella pneumoniae]